MNDVLGTVRAEDIVVDRVVRELMDQFVDGAISLEEFSVRVDAYAGTVGNGRTEAAAA